MPDSRRYVAAGTARTSGSWLARTIDAWYDVCARANASRTAAVPFASSDAVGSSARSAFGPFASARATATRCDSPTEISFGRRVARRARSNASSRSATRWSAGCRARRSGASGRRVRRGSKGASSSRSRSGPRRGRPPPGRRRGIRPAARPRGRRTISTGRAPTGPVPAWPLAIDASSEEDFVSGRRFLVEGRLPENLMASKRGTRRKRATRRDDSPLTEPRYLFARNGESLARLAEAGLAECRTRLDELVSTAGPRTIPNLLVPYDRLMLALQEVLSQTHFLFDVHPNPDLRKVADHWYQEAQRFATELSLNRPLYDAFTALDASGEDDETRYALEKILRDFLRSGVDRDEATRARVQALRDEITAIGQDFDRIIREDVRSISVDSPGELEGLPEDFVEGHAPGPDGKITLTTNYPDSIPVFRYARNADVRRRLQFEYLNRGHPANLEVLARLLAKRHELASVLGYESYAEYIVQDKMVRSSKAVADFLAKVTAASAARAQEDVARLLERKQHDVPGAAALDAWDPNYYSEVVRAEKFAFDAKLLRPYFAFTKVRDGLFALTGELFGVRYERVSGVPVWHASVEVYDVYDGSKRLGRFYLDLHPRKDKYTHAAAEGLVTGIRGAQLPQAALMCNFPNPADGPALMDYREVETFFHEFGHLLHSIFQGHGRWVKNTGDGDRKSTRL